jgi:glycosyltransferase involved in cell wall biosynthesis
MKIAHIIYSLNTGGAEILLVDIANEQIAYANVNIVIINEYYDKSLISKIDKRIEIKFINRIAGSKNPYSIFKLNLLLLSMNCDILHCHNHDIIPLLLPHFKKRAVLTVHTVNVNAGYFRQYAKLFAISQIVKEDICKRSGLSSSLVYNGVSTNKILRRDSKITDTILKIVIVSRLDHEIKGQHLALHAIKYLKGRGISNIHLDLIGSGRSEKYLKDLTDKLRLSNDINFLGLKDQDYIYTHLKDYDLLIQPSFIEGFGLAVIEAMAAKLPVVVANIDGPMEIIEKGKYGFFFRAGDYIDLADKIEDIILNITSEKILEKVEQAYEHVKANFEISTTAQRYLSCY